MFKLLMKCAEIMALGDAAYVGCLREAELNK
jgi:hypothetical protein